MLTPTVTEITRQGQRSFAGARCAEPTRRIRPGFLTAELLDRAMAAPAMGTCGTPVAAEYLTGV